MEIMSCLALTSTYVNLKLLLTDGEVTAKGMRTLCKACSKSASINHSNGV